MTYKENHTIDRTSAFPVPSLRVSSDQKESLDTMSLDPTTK